MWQKLRRLAARPEEIRFRILQETNNLLLLAAPPQLPRTWQPTPLSLPQGKEVAQALLADPATAGYCAAVASLADRIRHHRFPVLGIEIEAGEDISWRRDLLSGVETAPIYFRRIPYLDAQRTGDHKVIWEINRHQHLVLLAQDWLLHGEKRSLLEIVAELESWIRQNPFQRGINWTSALEVAFRSLSWLWILHLAGDDLEPAFRRRCEQTLFLHGHHLAHNLSIYFSPNTHLLGEALALAALGRYFSTTADGPEWQRVGDSILQRELSRQTRPDGSYFEQSSYYHVYAVDMYLFWGALSAPSSEVRERIAAMADFLLHLLGPSGVLPFLGDDDGGRLMHPFGSHAAFGRASLVTAGLRDDPPAAAEQSAWWGGPLLPRRPAQRSSRYFPDTGIAILTAGTAQIVFDAGPFGPGTGGHSHADTLSVTVSGPQGEILIDPGTYCYTEDPAARDDFRGAEAHNTLSVAEVPQAMPAGPFSWKSRPQVRMERCRLGGEVEEVQAACRFGGLVHRRRLVFYPPSLLLLFDELLQAPGQPPDTEFTVKQNWLTPGPEAAPFLWIPGAEAQEAWRSPALRLRVPALRYTVTRRQRLPLRLVSAIRLDTSLAWEDHMAPWPPLAGSIPLSPQEDTAPWRE